MRISILFKFSPVSLNYAHFFSFFDNLSELTNLERDLLTCLLGNQVRVRALSVNNKKDLEAFVFFYKVN
jgi:hypothetical protein